MEVVYLAQVIAYASMALAQLATFALALRRWRRKE